MVQDELKKMLQYLLKEIENENIISIDELIHIVAEQMQDHILLIENL